MKKLLIGFALACLAVPAVFGGESGRTVLPAYTPWSNDGVKIYNGGNDGTAVSGMSIYVVGGTTTSAASVTVFASSMSITTTGGLYPGTTYMLFTAAALDTVTELSNFITSVSTATPGFEGGVVCSTPTSHVGKTGSTNLTVVGPSSCLGSANAQTLTVTPAASQTATVTVHKSSMSFITTNGLYPGTYQYAFTSSTETLTMLKTALEAVASTSAGIDGRLYVTIPESTYELNCSSDMTVAAAQDFLGATAEKTLDLDTVYGFVYLTPAVQNTLRQSHLTGCVVSATFGSGTTNLKIYDGVLRSGTTLYHTPLTTATEKTLVLPPNGDFAGSNGNRLRIEVVGTAAVTAGYINSMGYKE